MESNRRKLIKGTAGAFAVGALAGCSDLLGDGDDEDPEEVTVSVLAEGSPDIAHACAHADDLGDPHDAAGSADDAEIVDFDTHTVYDITVEGESGFIGFEMHDDDSDDGHAHSHVGGLDYHDAYFDETPFGVDEIEFFDGPDYENEIAEFHGDHWHDDHLPHIDEGDELEIYAKVEQEEGGELELDGDPYELQIKDYEDPDHAIHTHNHMDHVDIEGEHHGETHVAFELYNTDEDEAEFRTNGIKVEVEDHDGHDHDHDHMVFFTRDAQIEIEEGTLIQETTLGEGAECEDADEDWEKYVEIDPDHGEAMLEIQPE